MLGNALRQPGYSGTLPTAGSWRKVVAERVAALDWRSVGADVAPLLESSVELSLLTADSVLRGLEERRR